MSDDELAALVATEVMGFTCIHRSVRVPLEVTAAGIAEEWKEEHGVDCPPQYALNQAAYQDEWDYPPRWCDKCHKESGYDKDDTGIWNLPDYPGEIGAAWLVVEKMEADGWDVHLDSVGFNDETQGKWRAWFSLHDNEDEYVSFFADGETASVTICLASLKTLGVEIPA